MTKKQNTRSKKEKDDEIEDDEQHEHSSERSDDDPSISEDHVEVIDPEYLLYIPERHLTV